MIIDQNEHDECFFKIYEDMGIVNFDFLTDRKINIDEVKDKVLKIMDICTKVIFLAQRFEENDIDSNDNDIVDKLIEGRNNERTNH